MRSARGWHENRHGDEPIPRSTHGPRGHKQGHRPGHGGKPRAGIKGKETQLFLLVCVAEITATV